MKSNTLHCPAILLTLLVLASGCVSHQHQAGTQQFKVPRDSDEYRKKPNSKAGKPELTILESWYQYNQTNSIELLEKVAFDCFAIASNSLKKYDWSDMFFIESFTEEMGKRRFGTFSLSSIDSYSGRKTKFLEHTRKLRDAIHNYNLHLSNEAYLGGNNTKELNTWTEVISVELTTCAKIAREHIRS